MGVLQDDAPHDETHLTIDHLFRLTKKKSNLTKNHKTTLTNHSTNIQPITTLNTNNQSHSLCSLFYCATLLQHSCALASGHSRVSLGVQLCADPSPPCGDEPR